MGGNAIGCASENSNEDRFAENVPDGGGTMADRDYEGL
jgi:hypothetical protein